MQMVAAMIRRAVALGFLALGLGACANMDKINKDISRLESGLNDVRGFQAEQTAKVSALESQLRELSGKFEELEYGQRERVGTALNALKNDVSNLRQRVPPPPIVPAEALEEDEASLAQWPAEIAAPFGDALQMIRLGDFRRALAPLDEASTLSSGTEWGALILFWTAVSFDGLNENDRALQNYHEMVTRYRKHSRVPLALLRQASVFIRMGDTKTARLTLNKLIADYPRSAEAAKAKERLKDL